MITLELFGSDALEAGYIGWSPVPLTIKSSNPSGGTKVRLRSTSIDGTTVPRAVFMEVGSRDPIDEIEVDLGGGGEVVIAVAGKFQPGERHNGASEEGKDVRIEAVWSDAPEHVEGSLLVMIRVRKNANLLSENARNDFLAALAALNGTLAGPGGGVYVTDFVRMHVGGASGSEHGDSHFLPWHRLYLLDLERLLQEVDPAVTLPYWRFDEAAPNVFSEDFMGATEQLPPGTPFTQGTSDKTAKFSPFNPLAGWAIGSVNGIQRAAFFDTETEAAPGFPTFRLLNQAQTLALGGANGEFGEMQRYFSSMEGTPHGAAHISFNGYVNFVPVAPRDPLFFLLHCNVDRLWAVWQFLFKREEPTDDLSYPYQAAGQTSDPWKLISGTQWPWDDSLSVPDGLQPPGSRAGNFTLSQSGKMIAGNVPKISDAIDAFGVYNPGDYLGFCYDDVPYDFERQRPVIA